MLDFATLSDVNLLAFKDNNRLQDVVAKKQEIVNSLAQYHNLSPRQPLFVGFSGFVMAGYTTEIAITSVGENVLQYLTDNKIKYRYIPEIELVNYRKKFDVVVVADEYFTYADSDQTQKDLVVQISSLATDYIITTLRDYKNQDYKEREFSQPSLIRTGADGSIVFLEAHNWSQRDRANWESTIYAIDQKTQNLKTFGDFTRRTMYFKQLANFSNAAGATDFVVHKNLMYKGLVKKNYEHVITITFN